MSRIIPISRIKEPGVQVAFDALEKYLLQLEIDTRNDLIGLATRLSSGFTSRDELAQPTVRTRDFQRTIASAENGTVVIWIPEYAEKLGAVSARSNAGAKIPITTVFSTLVKQTGPPPAPANDDTTGDYYIQDLVLAVGNKKTLSYIEILITNNSGGTVHNETFEFDPDKFSDFKTWELSWGPYNIATNKYPLHFSYKLDGDLDSGAVNSSVRWAVHDAAVGDTPDDADFNNPGPPPSSHLDSGCINADFTAFTAIYQADPDETVFFIARTHGTENCTGTKPTSPDGIISTNRTAPPLGDSVKMKNLIDVAWLIKGMQEVSFSGSVTPIGTSEPYRQLLMSTGTIAYGDGDTSASITNWKSSGTTTHTLNSGASPSKEYIFYDKDDDVDSLQTTTTRANAIPNTANPNRVLLGIARAVGSGTPGFTLEYAFLLMNGTSELF